MRGVLIVHVVCVPDELHIWCLEAYTVSKKYIQSAQGRRDSDKK